MTGNLYDETICKIVILSRLYFYFVTGNIHMLITYSGAQLKKLFIRVQESLDNHSFI